MALLVGGCELPHARLMLRPAPVSLESTAPQRHERPLAIRFDPALDALQVEGVRRMHDQDGPVLSELAVDYEMGSAVTGTVLATLRARGENAVRVTTDACPPDARGLLSVGLARAPYVHLFWTPDPRGEFGGSTLEIALTITNRRCSGERVWRRYVIGYGTGSDKARLNISSPYPHEQQFEPAATNLLQDLAHNLGAVLDEVEASTAAGGAL